MTLEHSALRNASAAVCPPRRGWQSWVWRSCFPYNTGVTKQSDLIAYVFEGRTHLLSSDLRQWMENSARFTAFVETYRDKIRKKLGLKSKNVNLRSYFYSLP